VTFPSNKSKNLLPTDLKSWNDLIQPVTRLEVDLDDWTLEEPGKAFELAGTYCT